MTLVNFGTDVLTVRPWEDPIVDRVGFDPRSPYVERFWLGVIGPSTTWLLRRIAAGFDTAPEGFEMPLGETARALGLGDRSGRNSPFFRTINRMFQFDLATSTGFDEPIEEIAVRRRLPALGLRESARLTPPLREAHERWMADQRLEPPNETQRRRSRQLALSLLELGEHVEEVELQLLRWRYHPALSRESAMWAEDRHRQALQVAETAG